MTDQQLKTVIALLTGMQMSLVHLSNLLAATSKVNHEEIAASFETTADAIHDETENKAAIQLVLRQVANGIRNSQAGGEWNELLARLLH